MSDSIGFDSPSQKKKKKSRKRDQQPSQNSDGKKEGETGGFPHPLTLGKSGRSFLIDLSRSLMDR